MGRVGDMALAAVAMGTTLRLLLISPMMGLSAGGMAVVARHKGAREQREADRAVMQTILLLCLFTLPISTIGIAFGRTFLGWMGATGSLLHDAYGFLRIICLGLLFMEMLPTINGVIRGAGHPEYTARINIAMVVTLLVVEPVLALGWGPIPALGVRGAAWGAVLSSAMGVMAQVVTLLRGWAGVRLHMADLRVDLGMMRRILKVAIPTSAQRLSPNTANAVLVRLVSFFGAEVLAAYSVIMQISAFFQCPALGMGSAAGALVGQNLGAAKPDRSERSAWSASAAGVTATLVLYVALLAFPTFFLGLFDPGPKALTVAVQALPFFLASALGMTWMNVLSSALAGAADAVSPMIVQILALWVIQIPASWLFSRMTAMGPAGIWLGLALGNLVGAAAISLRFRSNHWKTIQI
jgi:putative MATE family efflux protein